MLEKNHNFPFSSSGCYVDNRAVAVPEQLYHKVVVWFQLLTVYPCTFYCFFYIALAAFSRQQIKNGLQTCLTFSEVLFAEVAGLS